MSTLSGACVLCVLVPHLMGQLGAAMIVSKLKGARQRKRATGVKVEGRKSYGEADRSRATVERAKALKVEGLTLRQVAERLASEGYQTSAGTPYQFTAVGRMTPMWHHSRADEGNRYGRLRREVGQPALVLARTWEKRSVICSDASADPRISFGIDLYSYVIGGANSPLVEPTNSEALGPNEDSWFGGNIELSTVPEPSTWAMMLLGFAGLGYASYRRARAGRATLAA